MAERVKKVFAAPAFGPTEGSNVSLVVGPEMFGTAAAARKWIQQKGRPDDIYQVIVLVGDPIRVEVETVERRHLYGVAGYEGKACADE